MLVRAKLLPACVHMWTALEAQGIASPYIALLRSLYTNQKGCVRTDASNSHHSFTSESLTWSRLSLDVWNSSLCAIILLRIIDRLPVGLSVRRTLPCTVRELACVIHNTSEQHYYLPSNVST